MFNISKISRIDQPEDDHNEGQKQPLIKRTDEELEYNRKVGKILKGVRLSKGILQYDIAAVIGKSMQQYQKYEYGDSSITMYTAKRLCEYLGVTFDEIFAKNPQIDVSIAADAPRAEVLNLVKTYSSIGSSDFRKLVLKLASSLSKHSPQDKEES